MLSRQTSAWAGENLLKISATLKIRNSISGMIHSIKNAASTYRITMKIATQQYFIQPSEKHSCLLISLKALEITVDCIYKLLKRETIFKFSFYYSFSPMNNFDFLEQSLKEEWNLFYHANVNAKM